MTQASGKIPKKNNEKLNAKIALAVVGITILHHLVAIWQVKFQIVSDFIPKELFWDIAHQHIVIAIATSVVFVATSILFYYKKNYVVIILGILTLVAQQVYLHL